MSRTLIARLVAAGAQGYCLKGVAAETLVLAMRSVIAGASWWDAAATAEIHTLFQNTPEDLRAITPEIALTPRESEILNLIAAHQTDRQIAAILYITPGTVRVHVHTILHKLGVSDRKQATAIARQHHLLENI